MPKKQKSGLYRTKIKIGVDADGKNIVKWISGKTQRELGAERRRVLEHYIDGKKSASDKPFGACAQSWFDSIKKASSATGGKSPSTIESYRTALNKDILPVFGNRNMRAIQSAELQDFVDNFAGKSRTKITYICAALDGVFEYACKDKVLAENPCTHVKRPDAKEAEEKRSLTAAERNRIVAVAKSHPQGAYLACMYYLGARPGEIRGLQWGDFDWERALVHIQRDIDYKKRGEDKVGALKNKKSNRFVPIPQDLAEILRPLQESEDHFVFSGTRSGSSLSKTSAERLWVRLMVACQMAVELPKGANAYRPSDIRSQYKPIITPHSMRHNYVTMCWENGMDVYIASKLAGHKSIKTTMDIYTHLSDSQLDKAIESVDKMFTPSK